MSFNSDVAPRQQHVQTSPTLMKKAQPTNVPKHAHDMRNVRKEKRKKSKKTLSSPSSLSSPSKDSSHNSLPSREEEETLIQNKGKGIVDGHVGIVSLRKKVNV